MICILFRDWVCSTYILPSRPSSHVSFPPFRATEFFFVSLTQPLDVSPYTLLSRSSLHNCPPVLPVPTLPVPFRHCAGRPNHTFKWEVGRRALGLHDSFPSLSPSLTPHVASLAPYAGFCIVILLIWSLITLSIPFSNLERILSSPSLPRHSFASRPTSHRAPLAPLLSLVDGRYLADGN